MDNVASILESYKAVCTYCDDFFSGMQSLYPKEMRCAKSCAQCCELTSVCALEAYIIIHSNDFSSVSYVNNSPEKRKACIMLSDDKCIIYKNRPVICRSHGLALLNSEKNTVSSCPLNFTKTAIESLPSSQLFNTGVVTDNIMRFNLAFCLLIGNKNLAAKRIPLSSILSGSVAERILYKRFH